jgi:16S rRNA processing protein RimM
MNSRRRQAAARRKEKNQKKAGASPVVPPAFLLVGKLHRPHGVSGEIIMSVLTDFPERLKPNLQVYMGVEYQPVTIKSLRHHNRGLLISLEGYDSREAVDGLRNNEIFVPTEDRPPLPDGELYLHQIIGLKAVTEEGQVLGIISDWIETGANGVFIVQDEEEKEILLPDIDEVIVNIDLEAGEVLVHLLEGLV